MNNVTAFGTLLGEGSNSGSGGGGGGVHPAVWGSLIGVVVMFCCAFTFYKYWCGEKKKTGERTIIIQQ